jgi:hypothetical protein
LYTHLVLVLVLLLLTDRRVALPQVLHRALVDGHVRG